MKTLPLSVVAAAAVLLPGVLRAPATPRSWVPVGEADDWFFAGNWTPAGTPAAADEITLANFGTANIASA